MAGTVLFLGPVAFQDFEVASGVSFGGVQRIAQHDLPGGGRVIDALGDAQSAIAISGVLSGPEATGRARILSSLRSAGAVLPLTWDVFFYTVIVQAFRADFLSASWIPFQLTCAVLRDEAAALPAFALSIASSVAYDLTAAIEAAPQGIDLSSAAAAAAAVGSAERGAQAYGVAVSALSEAKTSLAAGLSSAESAFSPDRVFAAASPIEGIAALRDANGGAGQLAGLSIARAYVGRATANLANAST